LSSIDWRCANEYNLFSKETAVHELLLSMATAIDPILATFIWVGGGSLGLIILIVIIVLVLRR